MTDVNKESIEPKTARTKAYSAIKEYALASTEKIPPNCSDGKPEGIYPIIGTSQPLK